MSEAAQGRSSRANFVLSRSTRVSIVGVSGVSSACAAGASSYDVGSGGRTRTASTLAAYPQTLHSTNVSSPMSAFARNSSDFEPPMAPECADTMT